MPNPITSANTHNNRPSALNNTTRLEQSRPTQPQNLQVETIPTLEDSQVSESIYAEIKQRQKNDTGVINEIKEIKETKKTIDLQLIERLLKQSGFIPDQTKRKTTGSHIKYYFRYNHFNKNFRQLFVISSNAKNQQGNQLQYLLNELISKIEMRPTHANSAVIAPMLTKYTIQPAKSTIEESPQLATISPIKPTPTPTNLSSQATQGTSINQINKSLTIEQFNPTQNNSSTVITPQRTFGTEQNANELTSSNIQPLPLSQSNSLPQDKKAHPSSQIKNTTPYIRADESDWNTYNQALIFKHDGDYVKAKALLKPIAEKDSEFRQQYAYLCCNTKDYAEAFKYLKQEAELDNPQAMIYLSNMYNSGEGVEQNHVEAHKIMEKAARLGTGVAWTCLGFYYLWGDGVPANKATAYNYFANAAKLGEIWAHVFLGQLYVSGEEGIARTNLQKAASYANKAADLYQKKEDLDIKKCIADLYCSIGYSYFNSGDGINMMEYFHKSAKLGNNMAKNMVEACKQELQEFTHLFVSSPEYRQEFLKITDQPNNQEPIIPNKAVRPLLEIADKHKEKSKENMISATSSFNAGKEELQKCNYTEAIAKFAKALTYLTNNLEESSIALATECYSNIAKCHLEKSHVQLSQNPQLCVSPLYLALKYCNKAMNNLTKDKLLNPNDKIRNLVIGNLIAVLLEINTNISSKITTTSQFDDELIQAKQHITNFFILLRNNYPEQPHIKLL